MPKIVDHDSRRSTLAEAAGRIIAREGLACTSVRKIGHEAGVSPSLVTHYFGDRDQVLLHAYRQSNRRAARRFAERIAEVGGMRGLALALEESLPLSAETEVEWRIRLAFWGHPDESSLPADEQLESNHAFLETVAASLREAQESGALRTDLSPEAVAAQLASLLIGVSVGHLVNPNVFSEERARAVLRDYLGTLE
ncbi:MAG: TetR/AcrR family transcriptional regulator [Proteobacteria bacterium]|nr:TetR/AcrR family transcriptional regulator [Pseudomonadota bacterium]